MAKTKRTAKEVEAAVESTVESAVESTVESTVAAASSDSKLITQSKLSYFATGFWNRIKRRYDNALNGATLTQSTNPDKKLTFTRVSGTSPLEINLEDYARLTDKSEFKKDVSADNVAILSNRHIGTSVEYTSQRRSLGFRQLTVNSFSDRYVDHIKIYMPTNIAPNTNSTWSVWAIKKGANGKEGDTVARVIYDSETFAVKTANENSVEKKFVIIPIKKSFENDTYFIVRCTTHSVEVVSGIKGGYEEDVVNMNSGQPPMNQGDSIDWNNGSNEKGNTALMYLFGRESIGTLSQKLNKLNSDSDLYVKQEEVSASSVPNKVVKLDSNGKLNKDMLPSIAINKYFEITEFTNPGLSGKVYENGDVAVVNNNNTNSNHGKKYLCINKVEGRENSTDDFIELNSKDGSVVSVNGKNGAVVLGLAATENSLKLTIGNGTTDVTETSVPIITNNEIDTIIAGLQD